MVRKGQGISDLRDASVPIDLLQKNRKVGTVPQALELWNPEGIIHSETSSVRPWVASCNQPHYYFCSEIYDCSHQVGVRIK